MKQIEYRKQKTRKARKYLAQMAQANSKLYFLTLTFNDEKLSNTSESTRHQYVFRFLDANCADYYANIDYGTKNHREHYHAVVALKNGVQPQKLREWEKNGFIDIKLVQGEKSSSKLGKYLTKLSCHSDKATAGKSFHKRKSKTPITYNPYADTNAYNFIELRDDDELPF